MKIMDRILKIIIGAIVISASWLIVIAVFIGIKALFFHKSGTEVYVLVDTTDQDSFRLHGSSLVEGYMENQSIYDPLTMHISELSTYHNNSVHDYMLPKQTYLLGNSHRRKKVIAAFGKQIDTLLSDIYDRQTNKEQSNIFEQIIKVSNELADSRMLKKQLVVASDLQDNLGAWSSYKETDLRLVHDHPEQVEKILLQGQSPKDYHGVSIIFIHVSRNLHDDELYNCMSAFYKQALERYGASVYFENNRINE